MDTPDTETLPRHGGGLDAAVLRYGGAREDWLDLSTGINPQPYPLPVLDPSLWHRLPDSAAMARVERAARAFWGVPAGAAVLAGPGTSALIARIPALRPAGRVAIDPVTYAEHAAGFAQAGWQVVADDADASTPALAARVAVNPCNPTGRRWQAAELPAGPLTVIDESFADTEPACSLMALAARPGTIVLKGMGKFWGLAGLRLGFAIGDPALIAGLAARLGPWPVSGPALAIGAAALDDAPWAARSRARLAQDAARLDALLQGAGAQVLGGTDLFRLCRHPQAAALHDRLAQARILTRRFAQDAGWLRLGLPGDPAAWARLGARLGAAL